MDRSAPRFVFCTHCSPLVHWCVKVLEQSCDDWDVPTKGSPMQWETAATVFCWWFRDGT
jgi:hypothetical protein